MIIKVKRDSGKYVAQLFLEENAPYATSNKENRPGCAVRTVVNAVQRAYGDPPEEFSIVIEEW